MLAFQTSAARRPCAIEGASAARASTRTVPSASRTHGFACSVLGRQRRRPVVDSVRTFSLAYEPSTASTDNGDGSEKRKKRDVITDDDIIEKGVSYNKQYSELFSKPLVINKPVLKPDKAAQAQEDGATRVAFSDVFAVPRHEGLFKRYGEGKWESKDYVYVAYMAAVHGLCLLAPATFSWEMVGLFFASYFVSGCLGITLSYHRQLSHRSFQTPKWLEYFFAYCGVLAVQGDPIEWVSCHRYHHLHTDTPLDPHSPYEGFWWSHWGWLMDHRATRERVHDMSNANELRKQWFYRFLEKTYPWHVVAQVLAFYAFGGLPAVIWGFALRAVWVYHVTWFVNSACHVWGYQKYRTGDLSTNNWWVGILAWGEGWHNNHHAFEFSARHGLEWWQFDMTWMVIKSLEAVGLAKNIKLPTEAQKRRLLIQ